MHVEGHRMTERERSEEQRWKRWEEAHQEVVHWNEW